MRIYLTGFMASGKSTVGPRVAERLGLRFIDLDAEIEAKAGRSIRSIFAEDGERTFRSIETDALHTTTEWRDCVVALGGGALVDSDNLAFTKRHGTVVYLRVPLDELTRRLKDEADERPLLQDASGTPLPLSAMRATIKRMLQERQSFYAQADHTVDAARPVDEVVERVVASVRRGESG